MIRLLGSSLFAKAFAATTAAIVLLFLAMYLQSVPYIQNTMESIEEQTAKTVLNDVTESVTEVHRHLDDYRQSLLLARKEALRSIVEVVASRVAWFEKQVETRRMTPAQARTLLLNELRQINYGKSDYVWAADYRSYLISHPDPKLNGADFSRQRDVRGNLIVPPMVEGARASGVGFHSYWWRRLGEDTPIEKVSYYRHFPSFALVIGTGVYIDDIEDAYARGREHAIDELRLRLHGTHLAKTGYLYIFDAKTFFIHPNPDIEGKPLAEILDPVTRKPIADQLKEVADQPGGFRYKWDKPTDRGRYIHEKVSWVRYESGFDWYIGSSVYVDELDVSARELRNRMLIVFVATLLLALILVYFLVGRLTRPLERMSRTAQQVEEGDFGVRCGIRRGDEIGTVAQAFDSMVGRLEDNIKNLDSRILERTAELEAANRELKELDRLKSDFLSTVSHELRTPMTSIAGFVKLVRKKLDEVVFPQVAGNDKTTRAMAQVTGNLDIIVAESERLGLLINDVLDSAKLEAGKVEWQLAPHAPAALIERAVSVTAHLADEKNIVLVWFAQPDLPAVMADEGRIQQVLINLISNAIKFSPQGRIEVTAGRNGAYVNFMVRDNGIGIAPKFHEKIFDKFQQIGDTLTEKPQGTGLGLSICRQIVEGHGGRIWVESVIGKGSEFHFELPIIPG